PDAGAIPLLSCRPGPRADRPALAGKGRCFRCGAGGLSGCLPRLSPVSRQHGKGLPRLAAPGPGFLAGEPGATLPGHAAPRCAAGATTWRGAGPVVAGPGPRPHCPAKLAQPAGCPPRAVRAPVGGAESPAWGVTRSFNSPPPGRADVSGSGPAPGPYRG